MWNLLLVTVTQARVSWKEQECVWNLLLVTATQATVSWKEQECVCVESTVGDSNTS